MKSSTNKILTIAVILLLVTNIALVIFMVKGKSHRDTRTTKSDAYEMMVKELGMTDQQQKDYKQLKEDHFKSIRPLFDSLRAAKSAFFSLIKDSTIADSTINSYEQQISEKQSVIDKLTFAHFKRVRNLFTPEQQPKFDEFIKKMMQQRRKDSTNKGK